jgi:hypothetical protein
LGSVLSRNSTNKRNICWEKNQHLNRKTAEVTTQRLAFYENLTTSIVICISRPRNLSLTSERKIVAEAAYGRGKTISRMLKDFAVKVYTQHFCATEQL